jgi:hypothetical protein
MWFVETDIATVLPTLKRDGYKNNLPLTTAVRLWEDGKVTYRNGKLVYQIQNKSFTHLSAVSFALFHDGEIMNSTGLDIWRRYFSNGSLPLGKTYTQLCTLIKDSTEQIREKIYNGFPELVHTYRQVTHFGEGWFRDKAETAPFEPDPVGELNE